MKRDLDAQTPATRARQDTEAAFLTELETHGNVTEAARSAGIARATVYVWREDSDDFRRRWDEALEIGIDAVEQVAFDLARKGNEKLVMFLLERRRPVQYGRREEVTWRGSLEAAPMNEREVIRRLDALRAPLSLERPQGAPPSDAVDAPLSSSAVLRRQDTPSPGRGA